VRKLLAWDRYDTHEAVAAMNNLCDPELRLWLNLFLPSVKLVKKVRVGSRVRRVYDAARTPFERVRECVQADPEKVAKLEELRKRLDPFQLSRIIERKPERISRLANRRLSPTAEQPTLPETEPLRLGIPQTTRDSHFPSAATTATNLRLHFKCLDNTGYGYTLRWLDRYTTGISARTLKNQKDLENHKVRMTAARRSCSSALLRRRRVKGGPLLFDFRAAALRAFHFTLFMIRKSQNDREFLTAGRT
jgi:hypothetical protein